ncbi:hypothetical protein MNAN1_001546 [Malassezia nana]|uniref:Uncharacterized protein n=1 Tax=Malassezia nana TaxID=180528 RepID=A0AAF0EJ97_9BASI|nr:hypothetical protein MNAN1_001546 [Malassezia nana]
MAGKGWFKPMYGFHPHPPAFRHRAAATLLGGAMWFWLLVRAKEDGPVLLVRAIDLLQEHTLTGFVKRSTGPLSLAWWSDALSQADIKEPGRGWRPFKTVLVGDTLMFYKVPASMVPEVRRTFQIRSAQWPVAVLSTDDCQELNFTDDVGSDVRTLASIPDKSMHNKGSLESIRVPAVHWTSPLRHPELIVVSDSTLPNRWASRIESGTISALAHELVFGTQRMAGATDMQDTDTKTFLHLVFYALCTVRSPWYPFLSALRDYMILPEVDAAGVQRVSLFLDLLLWKRPLLHDGHEAIFFEHLLALIRELGRTAPASVAPMVRQLQLWRDQTQQEDRQEPTDWLGRAGASLSHRTDLAPLALCWNVADFVRQDPAEIARQIQSFHADRLMAFLSVPVTAYRLSSSVTECLLRSFRFDASRPHWLTHVILRQLLVDEAPERQAEAVHVERVRILEHWIEIASCLLHRSDLAGWVAVCAALCSRAVATLDVLWRGLPTRKRDIVTLEWSPRLVSFGWIEGVRVAVEPVFAIGSGRHVTDVQGGIPYLGNAGILGATATTLCGGVTTAQISSPQIPLASQEPEFERVRLLAQRLKTLYQNVSPSKGPIPIPEYQALFQRLSTYEFVLQTGLADYMGNAVVVDGRVIEGVHVDTPEEWSSKPVDNAEELFLFPTIFPVLMPGRGTADGIMKRKDLLAIDPRGQAYSAKARCAVRVVSGAEEVQISEDLILCPMTALMGQSTASVTAMTPQTATPTMRKHFPVEIRAATPTRLVDVLVLGTSHLVVRAPVQPPTDPVTYESLTVELDMPGYRDALLLSYRSWISAAQLFESLVNRWNMAESASREMALHERTGVPNRFPSWTPLPNASFAREQMDWDRFVSIRLNVLLALRRWLELNPREWIADLIQFDALYSFLRAAHQECHAIATDSPALVEEINGILQQYPTLTTTAIASMGLDCFAPCETTPSESITFDWALPAWDLLTYLESLAALPYALVNAHDLARASMTLEQIHSARHEWFEAATRDQRACLSMYRLMRCLPPGRQVAHAPAGSSLWDMLPPSIREICMIHEAVREWVEAQVTEPRIGLTRRVERLLRLVDAVLLSRASMARAMRYHTLKDHGMSMPLPQTFVECAILEGITSERTQCFHAAWKAVARQRQIANLSELLQQDIPLPEDQSWPPCTPDIGWTIAIFSHWAVRPRAREGSTILLEFSLYMSMADLVNNALELKANKVSDDMLNTVRARVGWLREATRKAFWPREKMLEDAAMEAMMDQGLSAAPMTFFDALNEARAKKLTNMRAALRRNSEACPMDTSEDFFAKLDDAVLVEQAESLRTPCDALLQAIPVSRASSVFRCYGAHIHVWPYQKHPFVMELEVPSGSKCTLKLPNYDEFCEWITRLQSIPNVRVDEAFDVGAYAAQVADHLGRTSASHVFGVPLRELYSRTGGTVLPPSIERLLQEIETRGLQEQGIYRISGTRSAVERLQQVIDSQPVQHINFGSTDIHVLTNVFKMWLRDLPEPLVPFAFYDALIESERETQHEERVRLMRKIVATFPVCHYLALERVTYHLALVAKASRANLMAAHNIGLVFGSTLLNPPASPTRVVRGIENLGRAAHVVKIMVVMHRHIFRTRGRQRACVT